MSHAAILDDIFQFQDFAIHLLFFQNILYGILFHYIPLCDHPISKI